MCYTCCRCFGALVWLIDVRSFGRLSGGFGPLLGVYRPQFACLACSVHVCGVLRSSPIDLMWLLDVYRTLCRFEVSLMFVLVGDLDLIREVGHISVVILSLIHI